MATITDTLETLFVTRGATAVINDFGRVQHSLDRLAQTQDSALTLSEQLQNGVQALGGPFTLAATGVGVLTAALANAARQFAEDEQDIFRTSIVLKNMGSSLPIEQLEDYANALQRSVAIDDEAVVALGGLLARFNLTGDEIQRALLPIIDASKATGRSLEDVGTALGRALATGRTQGLVGLVTGFKRTGDQVRDLSFLLDELEKRFAGAGTAQAGTLAGRLEMLQHAFENFNSAIGERLAPGLESTANVLSQAFQLLADNIDKVLFLTGIAIPGLGPLLGALQSGGNPATAVGQGGAPTPATEDTQKEIANNTRQAADLLARNIAGAGPIGSTALNIRGLSAALRAIR